MQSESTQQYVPGSTHDPVSECQITISLRTFDMSNDFGTAPDIGDGAVRELDIIQIGYGEGAFQGLIGLGPMELCQADLPGSQ